MSTLPQHANAGKDTPLLYRVGGSDTVRKVVEGFYRRLYDDATVRVHSTIACGISQGRRKWPICSRCDINLGAM